MQKTFMAGFIVPTFIKKIWIIGEDEDFHLACYFGCHFRWLSIYIKVFMLACLFGDSFSFTEK